MAYNKNLLYAEYCNIFFNSTGSHPNEEEKKYLLEFLDISKESKGKKIYYLSIFRLKRWYPLFLVHILMNKAFKRHFKKSSAPESIILISDQFTRYTLHQCIKAYARIND